MLEDLLVYRDSSFATLQTRKYPNSLSIAILEPSLTDQELEQLTVEIDRIQKVFKSVMEEQPLDFAFSFVKELPEESKT